MEFLVVKDYDSGNYQIVDTKLFNNIGEIKTYLVKNYNVPFDEIANKDICDIVSYNENENITYRFEIQ